MERFAIISAVVLIFHIFGSYSASAQVSAKTMTIFDPPIQALIEPLVECPSTHRYNFRKGKKQPPGPKLLYACAPDYPQECMSDADNHEVVTLLHDIGVDGVPTNLRIVESSNSCHHTAAARSLAGWRFNKTKRGASDLRVDVHFQLED